MTTSTSRVSRVIPGSSAMAAHSITRGRVGRTTMARPMSPSQRRVIGVVVAGATILLAAGYITWRLRVMRHRGWAGVSYAVVFSDTNSQPAALFAFKTGSVVMVYPDSPADRSGLQLGDRITAINRVPSEKLNDVAAIAAAAKFGDVLTYR